ncbi:hypothetical protein DL346_20785 [Paenibacillus montanisoli]|uniref:Alpha-glycerophosphate oxidase C-terminal domain-containing protein n=2 Tax=Paenibacillus montanisoli TaxID=2081970 RepID=A0A328TYM7_9BACL|nr:hypothetical protein DL346_20785 [Paenibacillus montanisoli]
MTRYAALRVGESGESGVAAGAAGPAPAPAPAPAAASAAEQAQSRAAHMPSAARSASGRITVSLGPAAASAAVSAAIVRGDCGEASERALRAELDYAIEEEMTCSAVDFLLRRTSMILFDRRQAEALVQPVLRLMGQRFCWSETQYRAELARVETELKAATEFPDRTQE